MKVTREVMNDLLPVYFSGEASADTRTLVEEYFRENPEFERMARGSARSLEMLQTTMTVAPEAKKEKRDLESVHKAVWRHKLHFGLALFFTLAPLAFVYSKGHFVWIMARNAPWEAGMYWLCAALFWVLYLVRPHRRTASLVTAIFFIVIPLLLLHGAKSPSDVIWAVIFIWCAAALSLVQFFGRLRRRTTVLMFAIFTTAYPIPFLLYSALTGNRNIMNGMEVFVVLPVIMWTQYFWLRRKANVNEDECL